MIYCRKKIDKASWHPWFAWYPIQVARQQDGCVLVIVRAWLETIWRKGTFECGWGDCYWTWEHAIEDPHDD